MQVQKTVFISYRRTNSYIARAVYQDLRAHDYDVFLDYENIDAGDFERIILGQIAARAHFIVTLTPSALERCANPGDWLRREIEHAIDNKRNIVPLTFEDFDFRDVQQYLTGKLAVLPKYNALEVPSAYFKEAMERLRERFLNKPLDVILHPMPPLSADVQQKIAAENNAPSVTEQQLSAEEYFERGCVRAYADYAGRIADYSKAIRLNPQFAVAYNNRGNVYSDKGVFDSAIADYSEAIRLDPLYSTAYNNRCVAYCAQARYDEAVTDADNAIHLNPQYANAYNNRGIAYSHRGELSNAIADYDQALHLYPQYANAYYNRGLAYQTRGDLKRAVADYDEAIRLNPQYALAYNNRGWAYYLMGEFDLAIDDYKAALRIDSNLELARDNLEQARRRKDDNP